MSKTISKSWYEKYVDTANSLFEKEKQLANVKVELEDARQVIKHMYETSPIDSMIDDEKKSKDCNDEYLAYLILDRKDMLDQIAKLSEVA